MIILIDNFDSFTYNIVQAYQKLGQVVHVVRNHLPIQAIKEMKPDLVIIGPGPGNPKTAGISKECVLMGFPIFGICLGHQVIGEVFGAKVVRAKCVMHGKRSQIFHRDEGVFQNLAQGFFAVRYNSLIIEANEIPCVLEITAWTLEDEIMGIRHRDLPIEGVQFHPESIASEYGQELFQNSLTHLTQPRTVSRYI